MLFVPPVVGQKKVQSARTGPSEVSGELIKLLQGLLVLGSKENGDVLMGCRGFHIDSFLSI